MRVLIASSLVPHVNGGSNKIAADLAAALRQRGFEVDTLLLPFRSHWRDIPGQTLAFRMLDLDGPAGGRADRVIAIRHPAYAVRHPNKVAWFIHHHRGAYDLWGTPFGDLPDTDEGRKVRDLIVRSDNHYLREPRRLFSNSGVVARRLREFNGLAVDGVLFPPLFETGHLGPGPFDDYFVYPSRLTPIKRQELAVHAMRFTRSPFRLLLVGTADDPSHEAALRHLVERLGLEDRVRVLGWVPEGQKAGLIARSCGVLNLAYDEDSYGYVTLEAFHCHKPVVTLEDSGGTSEVVHHDFNGQIVAPRPEELAEALEGLWADKARARDLGENAHETLRLYRLNWDHVIENLAA
jgi:glycosyltransferase involved in cell wall biosynthesis